MLLIDPRKDSLNSTFNHKDIAIENVETFERRANLPQQVDSRPIRVFHVNSLQNQRDINEWDRLYSLDYNPNGSLKEDKRVAINPPIELRLMPVGQELPPDIMLETNLGHSGGLDEVDGQVFYATKGDKKYAVFFKMPDDTWNDGLPLMETKSAIEMDATTLHHYQTIADGTYIERPGISNNTVFGVKVPNTDVVKYYVIPKVFDGKVFPTNDINDLKVLHDRILQDYKLEEFPSFYNIDDAVFWLKKNKEKWNKKNVTVEDAKDILEKNKIIFQEAVIVNPMFHKRKYDEINAYKDEASAQFDANLNTAMVQEIAQFEYESNNLIKGYFGGFFSGNFKEDIAPRKPSLTFDKNFLQSKRKQNQWVKTYGDYFDADGTLKEGITIFPALLEEYNNIISINGLPSTHPKFYKKGLTRMEMWLRNYRRTFIDDETYEKAKQ